MLSFILTHTVDPLPMQSSHLLLDTGQLQHGGGGATAFILGTLTDKFCHHEKRV